jgi:hemoglobin
MIANFRICFTGKSEINGEVALNQNPKQESKEMKKTFLIFAMVLVCAGAAFAQEKSLYQRLGGYDAIAAVSDDFLDRLGKSKRLGKFVAGMSVDSKKKLRQHLVDFLCNATGGPCLYLGRDMKTVHTGLGIDEADWKDGVDALVGTLDKFKVPEKEKNEVLGAVSGLKKDIVEKK